MEKLFRLALVFGLILNIQTNHLSAQENDDGSDKTGSPYFQVISDDPAVDKLPLKSTSAKVNITGVIADVIISQTYKNEGKNTLEAIYTFPASSKAAIYAMQMKIGDRTITAKIKEKEEARKEYETAKTEGKRTSLLEQQRPNVFTMNVANIMPGDEIIVELKYTELLVPEGSIYEFVYPTVVGPRYSNGSSSAGESFNHNPYQTEGNLPFYSFGLELNISTGMPLQDITCKSHKVNITYDGTSKAKVKLDASEKNAGNKDFILDYQLAGDQIQSGLMLYNNGDENFFLLMVQPPKEIKKEDIPPREYIFIVDVSGSMRGFPIETSKKLLRNLVTNLKPTDRFNVMLFESSSGWMADQSVFATEANITKAFNYIDKQSGGGGTEILPALRKAMTLPRLDEALSRSFIVITDGYVNVEKEAFDLIREKANEANTFAFGIGSGVNRYIIEGMAHVGRGEPFIITGPDEANEKAEKFRQYINQPVLTQISADFGQFDVYDVEPISIPDVMAERPVVIFGKYKGEPKGTITIKGYAGKKKYKESFDVSTTKPESSNSALRYLWARERIKLLDDYAKISYGDNNKEEVTKLGLKYNLMTAYTSFIAVDEVKVNKDGKVTTVKQLLPLPEGVSNDAVGFDMTFQGSAKAYSYSVAETKMEEFGLLDSMIVSNEFSIDIISFHPNELKIQIEERVDEELSNNMPCSQFSIEGVEIEVTVGVDGSISGIKFLNEKLSEEAQKCWKEFIYKFVFSDLKLEKEVIFVIKY